MAKQQLPFEYLLLAIEATRGTAETVPLTILNLVGTLKKMQPRWRPDESTGTKAAYHRSKRVRTWSELEAEGPLETNSLLVLLNSLAGAVSTPSTPASGVLTRLWEFIPDMTSDTREGLTLWAGDPNIQIWKAAFGMIEEVTIGSNADSEDGAVCGISGRAHFPAQVAAPTAPAYNNAPLFASVHLSVWLDVASAIGTTALTGRIVSAEHTLTVPVAPEFLATGPGGGLNYSDIGSPKSFVTSRLTVTVPDMTEYDHFADDDLVKLRVRHNGPLIETVAGPLSYYHYVEVDTYGYLDLVDEGDIEGSIRTFTFEVTSEYDSTLAADWRVAVQGIATALPS